MDKVDIVLVGSEAVVESGGLINAVGSNQMAIIAKAANVPFYAMAERFVSTLRNLKILLTIIDPQLQVPSTLPLDPVRPTHSHPRHVILSQATFAPE